MVLLWFQVSVVLVRRGDYFENGIVNYVVVSCLKIKAAGGRNGQSLVDMNRMTPIKRRNRVKYQFTQSLLLISVILFQPRVSQAGFALWRGPPYSHLV
jgi:hypothetical protein